MVGISNKALCGWFTPHVPVATIELYDREDIAFKLIPCLSFLLIDPEKPVRTNAFKTMQLFFKKAEHLAEEMVIESPVVLCTIDILFCCT